jgi:hypothetical protein
MNHFDITRRNHATTQRNRQVPDSNSAIFGG